MALGTKQNKKFLSPVNGRLALRVDKGTPGAVERYSEKKDSTLYELYYDYLEGFIDSVSLVTHEEYGININIDVTDAGETYTLTFPFSSKYANGFMYAIKNADLSKKVRFNVFNNKEGRGVLIMLQDDTPLKYYYTKATPNGLPQPKERIKMGVPHWDWSDVEEFLYLMIKNEIIPAVAAAKEERSSGSSLGQSIYPGDLDHSDDIPNYNAGAEVPKVSYRPKPELTADADNGDDLPF